MKEQRIALMMEPSLAHRIDSFRYASRIATRAEAMRVLIKSGLENEVATTGVEFGDAAPVEAEQNNTHEESCSAAGT